MEKETTCNIYKKKEEIKELIPWTCISAPDDGHSGARNMLSKQ